MHRVSDDMTMSIPSTHSRSGWWASMTAWMNTFVRKQPLGMIGALILIAIVLLAILAPVISPFDPMMSM